MKTKPIQDTIIALMALIIALAGAYGLDHLTFLVARRANRTFDLLPAL